MEEDKGKIDLDAELVKAAHNGSLDKLKVLVTQGAHLFTAEDNEHHTVVQIAREERERINRNLFYSCLPSFKSKKTAGYTGIIQFCEATGRAELEKALAEENFPAIIQIITGGFKLSPNDWLTWALLKAAIEHRHLEIGKLLVPRYLNPYDTYEGMSPIMYATNGDFRELVDHILSVSPKVSQ